MNFEERPHGRSRYAGHGVKSPRVLARPERGDARGNWWKKKKKTGAWGQTARQMSRAARPCDSFNQSLGCVPPRPGLTTADHASLGYAAPCQTHVLTRRVRVLPATVPPVGRTVPSRNLERWCRREFRGRARARPVCEQRFMPKVILDLLVRLSLTMSLAVTFPKILGSTRLVPNRSACN